MSSYQTHQICDVALWQLTTQLASFCHTINPYTWTLADATMTAVRGEKALEIREMCQ